MKNTLKISLKANEKIYINGAVVRVDRKTTVELLNETQFLQRPARDLRRPDSTSRAVPQSLAVTVGEASDHVAS